MSYTAPNRLLMPSRHSIDTLTDSWLPADVVPLSNTWPSANLAIYVPLRVPSRVVVVKLWFASGTAGTGNVDMALYDLGGALVVSATGAAKQASAGEQVFDVTDTVVGPGLYYIALSNSTATDTFYMSTPAAPSAAAYGLLTETSAYPLPSTATFARDNALAKIPVAGLLLEATVA